jgi:hypothetical protein
LWGESQIKPSPLEGEGWVGGGDDSKWTPPNLTMIVRVIETFWRAKPSTLALPLKGGGDKKVFRHQ